jgi:hypothetical protein
VLTKFHFAPRRGAAVYLILAGLLAGSIPVWSVTDADTAEVKLEAIELGKQRPGSRVQFSAGEVNGWMRNQAKARVPQGARNLRIDLAANRATGSIDLDFLKLQQGVNGADPGWLMKNLFAGEHPVTVTARFESANGRARVDVERVEISGVAIEGRALDFVIAQYVRPTFPDVKVNEWFPLRFGVDRFAVAPGGLTVLMAGRR